MGLCGFLAKFSLLLVFLVGLVAVSLPLALKQIGGPEGAVRKIVEVASIDKSVFNQLQVKDEGVWWDILTKGNLGIAEGYMHGKLDIPDALEFWKTLLRDTVLGTRRHEAGNIVKKFLELLALPNIISHLVLNQQTKDKSKRVAEIHYDAGNDLYEAMLGPSMSYTCAYWQGPSNASNLDQAQTAKFELVRKKLELSEGMKVVDLGMGWGTAAAHMHRVGKVSVTGVSLSKEQVDWAKQHLHKDGLTFLWQDYRDLCEDPKHKGKYDRAYSIGMMEHVGYHNHASFFSCLKSLLKPEGLAVVHTIGEPDFVSMSDPFLETYIFPGAQIPTLSSLTASFEQYFLLEDFQNFGHDYSKTLAAWSVNSKKFFKDKPNAYSVEFQRMWDYYLCMCEALFDLRINQLWQFVFSPRPASRTRIDRQI